MQHDFTDWARLRLFMSSSSISLSDSHLSQRQSNPHVFHNWAYLVSVLNFVPMNFELYEMHTSRPRPMNRLEMSTILLSKKKLNTFGEQEWFRKENVSNIIAKGSCLSVLNKFAAIIRKKCARKCLRKCRSHTVLKILRIFGYAIMMLKAWYALPS